MGARNGRFAASVTDTGPGMPLDQQHRLFDQFHQADSSLTKAKGGAGLAGRSSPLAAGMGERQAQAQTQDCTGMWKRADVNHKGILDGKELDKFRSVLNTVDTNKDGKISQSEFMTACQKGELKNIQL